MKKKKGLVLAAAILILLLGAFLVYAGSYYRADAAAAAALVSDAEVEVVQTAYGWLFDGPSGDCACVFYPGAKVEETAYAPFLHRLAAAGVDVCLLRVPLRFAFFAPNKAAAVMEQYDYARWFVGGHSLGGAIAALYAAEHGDGLDGLILCAAYPTRALDDDLTEILLYGSEDTVLNREKLEEGRQFAPDNSLELVIEGGNHAQFGSYGEQKGDGTPSLSAEEQWEEAVRFITDALFPEE